MSMFYVLENRPFSSVFPIWRGVHGFCSPPGRVDFLIQQMEFVEVRAVERWWFAGVYPP